MPSLTVMMMTLSNLKACLCCFCQVSHHLIAFTYLLYPFLHNVTKYNLDEDLTTPTGASSHFLGCEALQLIAKKSVISDSQAMRRLTRAVVPSEAEIPFCEYPKSPVKEIAVRPNSDSLAIHTRSPLLFRVGKLLTLSELCLYADLGMISDNISSSVKEELKPVELNVAIHCAALAIDAARILRKEGKVLCGRILDGSEIYKPPPTKAGLTYSCILDVDRSALALVLQGWPTLAALAALGLSKSILNSDIDSNKFETMKLWIQNLSPVLLVGLHDSLDKISTTSNVLFPEKSALSFLYGVRAILSASKITTELQFPNNELSVIVTTLLRRILIPTLGLSDNSFDSLESDDENKSDEPKLEISGWTNGVVSQTCGLLEDICNFCIQGKAVASKALFQFILLPLSAVEEGLVAIDDESAVVVEIISSCVRSGRILIEAPNISICDEIGNVGLGKAMLHFSLTLLSMTTKSYSFTQKLRDEAALLLRGCLEETGINTEEKQLLAKGAAEIGSWEAWAIVCSSLQDGSGISHSMAPIRNALCDINDVSRHLAALSAVRSAVQESSSNEVIGIMMNGVGIEVLQLLRGYGTMSLNGELVEMNRTDACANSMKILMISFQHLVAEEPKIPAFLAVVFETLVSLISFNGLPNNPSGRHGADPTLGRMCAQAMVHIARVAPSVFKGSMSLLGEEDRTGLEKAVRADMSGYAPPRSLATTKKKLNLKSFKSKA